MGFIGLLRLLAVLFCVWMIWRFVRKTMSGSGTASTTQSGSMVACDVCGTHVPEDDAISESGRWYCGKDHRDQDQA